MGITGKRLDSGQKGKAKVFLPISALGKISSSGDVSSMFCGGILGFMKAKAYTILGSL